MADPRETDTKWVESARAGEYENILMLKFEDVIGKLCENVVLQPNSLSLTLSADKPKWVREIADFVGLTDFNMDNVIDQISVANTIARRKAKFEAAD